MKERPNERAAQREDMDSRLSTAKRAQSPVNGAVPNGDRLFPMVAETLPIMAWVCGADTRRTYVNKQRLEFTGRTLEDELAVGWAEGVHPDEAQRCEGTHREAFRARESFQLEYRLKGADGQYRWILERGVPWYAEDGVFAGHVGCCVDITHLRRCQEVLQAEHDDLDRVVQARTQSLLVANARLQEDMAARELNEKRLTEQQAKLGKLASEVTVAQERERNRIARGLHDEVGQALAMAKVNIGELRESLPEGPNLILLDNIRDLLDQAAQATRSATFRLSPPVLHELGLEAALQMLCDECEKRDGIRFNFEIGHDMPALPDGTQVVVYRAVRELFLNIEKHARARNVRLTIRRDGQYLQITVEDDGVGFETSRIGAGFGPAGGFGLFSIREQLAGLGGRVEFVSSPNAGTRVVMTAPLG